MNIKQQSSEEKYIIAWLDELIVAGYVAAYTEQPFWEIFKKVVFTTKVGKKEKEVTLLKERIYTADMLIHWNKEAIGLFTDIIFSNSTLPIYQNNILYITELVSYFEVKASGYKDVTNTERFFLSRTQPLMYEKFDIYINLIKPLDLFSKTFVPKVLLHEFYYKKDVYTGKADKKKLKAMVGSKKYTWDYRTLEEYINSKASN